MKVVLGTLLAIGLGATAIIMAVGLLSLFKGGEFNKKYGNLLMRCRVVAQGATIALIAAWYFYYGF
jgi:ABC-type nickel/cobalt efflux system permease component RcnA